MTREKIDTSTGDLKPAPTLGLREKAGLSVVGTLFKKVENSTYAGKYDYLLTVEKTDAPTRLYDKETKTEDDVDLAVGEKAWLRGSTVLAKAFSEIAVGEKVEVIYTGLGEAKKGRKAPFLYDVFRIKE